jgi:hypothetical protein
MAYSPDGKLIASGASDRTILLWDVATTRVVRQFTPPDVDVFAVAFSPDGRLLASTSSGLDRVNLKSRDTISVWNVYTGREVLRFDVHEGISSLVFSPDGARLASSGDNGATRLWDAHAGKDLSPFSGAKGLFHTNSALVFSPDGKIMAANGADGFIQLWQTTTGKLLGRLRGAPPWPSSLHFLPGGKTLAMASKRGALRIWDLTTGKELRRIGTAFRGSDFAYSQDSRLVAIIDGFTLRLVELASGKEVWRFKSDSYVHSAAISPDGTVVASTTLDDQPILLWDTTGILRDGRLPALRLAESELAAAWRDLSAGDARLAHRAGWKLVAAGRQAQEFLADKLRPVGKVEPHSLTRLVANLDSDQFAVRSRAARQLAELRETAEPALRRALADRPSAELRQQVQRLLDQLGPLAAERLREARAVAVLDRLGMPEARQVLKGLAAGLPEARLTQEAQVALERLGNRPRVKQ